MSKTLAYLTKFKDKIDELRQWCSGNLYVYDIECYPNFFSCAVIHVKSCQEYYFECSPWMNNMNEFETFLYHLHHHQQEMVGFNNFGYDFPVIAHAFTLIPAGNVTPQAIYAKSNQIINTPFENRFDNVIWGRDQFVKQLDLFKINHYDNAAKATSLKLLEFNMGMDDIQELPVEPGRDVTLEEAEQLRPYNWHDIAATLLFLAYNTRLIDLRRGLTEKYNHDFMNNSDSKIGGDLFKMELKKAGLPVNQQTPRSSIPFADCIFDYVRFERPEFNEVLTWLKATTVEKTKECLNNIDVPYSLAQYMNPDHVKVFGVPDYIVSQLKLRKGQAIKLSMLPANAVTLPGLTFIAEHLHCVVDGFQFDFGTGGIHGSLSNAIVRADSRHQIKDVDVASYYPNLGIKNNLFPAHLGLAFCTCYEGMYNTRKSYNKKTHPMENLAFKLALNAAYGNSNNPYSFLYDPIYTMAITLNGQLLLCMLAEQMMKTPGLQMIQINTDGMTYKCPNEYVDHTMNLCRWWEQVTNLELEDVDYAAMYIRDVNNYIAEYTDGKLKNKGAYEYALAEQGLWHKNFNALIVAKAAEQALVKGVSTRDFIESCYGKEEHLLQFMCRTKIKRSDRLVMQMSNGERIEQQRVTRYVPAINGGSLIKVMPPTESMIELYAAGDHYQHETTGTYEVKKPGKKPSSGKYKLVPQHLRRPVPDREQSIESGWQVMNCNKLSGRSAEIWQNMNLEWYIEKANDLVDKLVEQ